MKSITIMSIPTSFWQLILAVIVVITVLFVFPFDLRKLIFQVMKLVEYEYSHDEIDLEHILNIYLSTKLHVLIQLYTILHAIHP